MTNMGTMHFYTGVPDSKVATLPSCPKKGKAFKGNIQKPVKTINRFFWGGYTVGIKNSKEKK